MKIAIFLTLLTLLILLTFIQKNNQITNVTNIVNSDKICILLTTCVNTNVNKNHEKNSSDIRKNIYNSVINNYLNSTNINIYIVESSGYTFPEFQNNPRIFIYTFKEINKPIVQGASFYESRSIIKAFNYFNLNKFEYIIKITGRYFIPNIEKLINNIPIGTDLIYQYKKNNFFLTYYQNCEIFGCKTIYLLDIMNTINLFVNFERTITLYSFKYKYFRFDKIILNECIQKGNPNKIYCIL